MTNGVRRPNDYAVVVGIDHYPNHGSLRPLTGAVNDAELFTDWLLEPTGGGLSRDHVKLIDSNGDAQDPRPFRDQVIDAMTRLVHLDRNGALHGCRLYLFFSGHGAQALGTDADACALLMANVDQLTFRDRHVIGKSAAENFRLADIFEDVVLFMDCCRTMTDRPEPNDLFVVDQLPGSGAKPYLYGFASEWSMPAHERVLWSPRGDLPQGLFTYALLEGLRHAANLADCMVHSDDLATYVKEKVLNLSQHKQKPVLRLEGSLTFGANLRGFPVTIRGLASPDQLTVMDGSTGATLTPPLHLNADASLVAFMPPGSYLFRRNGNQTRRDVLGKVVEDVQL